jgi:cytoskeletal protein CcmA (bactofilin family)
MSELSEIHVPATTRTFVVPRDATIVGTVYFDGPILVEGTVDGGVRGPTVQIAERGIVDGIVVADHVVVLGEVNGSIYAKDLVLRTACTVEGQIFHHALVLENGCYFEGQSRRYSNPVSMAPDP